MDILLFWLVGLCPTFAAQSSRIEAATPFQLRQLSLGCLYRYRRHVTKKTVETEENQVSRSTVLSIVKQASHKRFLSSDRASVWCSIPLVAIPTDSFLSFDRNIR